MDKRFRPPFLEHDQMKEIRHGVDCNRNRRQSFRIGDCHIRLLVDGDERLSFDPNSVVCKPFRVSMHAAFIELHGDDEQGDILLAAFLIPQWLAAARISNKVSLAHKSGRLMEIRISSKRSKARTTQAPLLQLRCSFL
jgi:hypothetical protein